MSLDLMALKKDGGDFARCARRGPRRRASRHFSLEGRARKRKDNVVRVAAQMSRRDAFGSDSTLPSRVMAEPRAAG